MYYTGKVFIVFFGFYKDMPDMQLFMVAYHREEKGVGEQF
jgi:hypothetical protein